MMVEGEPCDENPSRYRRLGQCIFLWNTYCFAKHGFQIKHNYEISYPFEWGRMIFSISRDIYVSKIFHLSRVPTVFKGVRIISLEYLTK